MGGSSNSTDTSNTTAVADERIAADGEAQVFRTGGDVNILDGGAVKLIEQASQDAFEAAEGITDSARQISLDGFDSIERVGRDTLALSEKFGLAGLDLARESLSRSNTAFDKAAGNTAASYADFANRSRTEEAQSLDQLITYGIPAIVIIMLARSYFS